MMGWIRRSGARKGKESEKASNFQLWIHVGGCVINQGKEYAEGRRDRGVDELQEM